MLTGDELMLQAPDPPPIKLTAVPSVPKHPELEPNCQVPRIDAPAQGFGGFAAWQFGKPPDSSWYCHSPSRLELAIWPRPTVNGDRDHRPVLERAARLFDRPLAF